MFKTLKIVGEYFRIPNKIYSYATIKQGNINATYKVTYINSEKQTKSYIFQKVNSEVFKNPAKMMNNIDKVTSHIRSFYPEERTLHFHHTATGENFAFIDGSFWRVINFVDSVTYDLCDDYSIIESTGKAFGHFQMQLSNFDGALLEETIPDFHNTKKRLDTLFSNVQKDEYGRVADVKEEIEYLKSVKEKASELSIRYQNGEFPIRVTHNDTKCNNVLFDKVTKKPILVIDLDTVMPGMYINDFGDAVRFVANTSCEDEPDLSRVYFDTAKFRAFCKGYIGEVKNSLTENEIKSLVLASFSITVELASRFLDDYITGDKYFKVNYPGHNLVRARCQIRLAQDIMNKYDELNYIVREEIRLIDNK